MQVDPETALIVSTDVVVAPSSGIASMSTIKRSTVVAGSVLAVIAALPVPYLVFKSVYFMTSGKENVPFHQMVSEANIVFWIFGPLISVVATLAVVPFNIYNCYRTINGISHLTFSNIRFNCAAMFLLVARGFALSFGLVNGYNMAIAYNDISQDNPSVFSHIIRGCFVAIATLFAGIDSRVAIAGLINEVPRDYRFIKPKLVYVASKIGFFSRQAIEPDPHSRKLLAIRTKLDMQRTIALFQLPNAQLQRHASLILNKDWFSDFSSTDFQSYLLLMDKPVPLVRYVISDWLGGAIALSFAIFNCVNTWSYTRNSVLGFFAYLGASSTSLFAQGCAVFFSLISTFISLCMSLFLIRDLFFRDILKPMDCQKPCARIAMFLLTLLPAFCFGLLNLALTFMNNDLSDLEKLIISTSSILGATVVLRYGIEGNLAAWRGHTNLRRELAEIPDKLMLHIKAQDEQQVSAYYNALILQNDVTEESDSDDDTADNSLSR